MSDLHSMRYDSLSAISAMTDGKCHLCHGQLDLACYGPPGSFGSETVTVDHIIPQAHGGDDRHDNLRLAHATCNILRGTKRVEEVRLALAGTTDEPLGTTSKNLIGIGVGALGYAAGGTLFASPGLKGNKHFNHGAAALTGIVTGIFTRITI